MTRLDRMRRHRNWLKWSLALVVLTFIIFYIPDFLQRDTTTAGATSRETVASVDGHDLFAGDDDFTILDFSAGAGFGDQIDLRNVAGIDDFGDVLASAHRVFGGVVLDFGDDEITLLGVQATQLNADDFLI